MNHNNIAHTLASALANPYSQYSSKYAQALTKVSNPHATPEGYTLSSTYNPPTRGVQQTPLITPQRAVVQYRQSQSSTWYQSGKHKCSYRACTFTGSQKSVETHMMDRHLIYPPGWDKWKKLEWDADPSLKGKPIPIQGTNIVLNTPEALESWIAERKKRWPTAQRVTEKKRKLEEAIQRGQIIPQDSPFWRKKLRCDESCPLKTDPHRRSRAVDGGWRGRGRGRSRGIAPTAASNLIKPRTEVLAVSGHASQLDTAEDSEGDDAPEVLSSKAQELTPQNLEESPRQQSKTTESRVHRRVPKRPPHNPFASRPTLLRNLLLPEIRITISNLSQAIRFLVDNDFLDDVELTPGEAEKTKIIQILEPPV